MQHAVGQLANNLLFSVGRQVAIAVKDATCKQEVKFMKASGVALQARNGPHRLLECKQLGQHSKLPPNNANAGSMRCGGAQYVAIAGHSKGRALAAHAMGSSECEQNCAPPSSTPRPRPRPRQAACGMGVHSTLQELVIQKGAPLLPMLWAVPNVSKTVHLQAAHHGPGPGRQPH